MRIETYLNAMGNALLLWVDEDSISKSKKHLRQYHAFRDRILREFAILRNFANANNFDKEQAWFWTDEWQSMEKQVDRHIIADEIQSFDSMDEFLDSLEDSGG